MSQVCKKHQEKPAKIYGKCIGCEIEWLNQRIREQEEFLKFYRDQFEELQLEVNDWRDAAIKWNKRFEESEESHSETKELLHFTISEIKRYKQALEEIARGRFSGASYKARQALEESEEE